VIQDKLAGASDNIIGILNKDLTSLKASTFLGGSATEYICSMVFSAQGDLYVCGDTYSTDYPVSPTALDPTPNGSIDVFVSKVSSDLKTLKASTRVEANRVVSP